MSDDEERLRERPSDRFAPSVRHLNLEEEFEKLLEETDGEVENHQQISLLKRRGLNLILFYFAEGGRLPDHQADGEVTIHVLEGELEIDTPDQTQRLTDGELLVLAPGVTHDVDALAPTKMLLTIGVVGGES